MTIILNNTGNPVSRPERVKINENWERIVKGLTDLQHQINILAGGQEVDDILAAIEDAIKRANEAQVKADDAVKRAEEAVTKADTAIGTANDAADNANSKAQDAENAANDAKKATQDALDALGIVNNKIVELDKALADAKTSTGETKLATEKANKAVTDTVQAISDAQKATQDAINATTKANAVAEELKGYGTAEVWNNNKSYIKNNIVSYNGSTWQAKVPNKNSMPAIDNANWILLAQRGVDGEGSVSSINGHFPDEKGNIEIPLTGGTVRSINGENPDGVGNVLLSAGDVDAYSKSEIDAEHTKFNEEITDLTTAQTNHDSNFLAHGGNYTTEMKDKIDDTDLYETVVFTGDTIVTSKLSKTLDEYDVITVTTKNTTGDLMKEEKFKLEFDAEGIVTKITKQ